MSNTGPLKHDLLFLKGGGELGKLTREFNWEQTTLGHPGGWPQSLKTTLSIILNSKFPMFLWWGPELICFYNDAYRPSLGENGKHPSILGMPAKEAWPEIWGIIKPLIDQVIEGEEAVWSEDQLVPIFRNGKIEDVYWTFSYSPIIIETGEPGGVLVTCSETTDKVLARRQLEASELNLREIIVQAPVAFAIFRGDEYKVEVVNGHALQLWGRSEAEVLGRPILEVMTELESQGIKALLDHVYQTGEPFSASELPVNLLRGKELETLYLNFIYQPLYAANGVIDGIITIGFNITEQVAARKKVEESEERFRVMAEGSGVLIGVSDENAYPLYFNKAWTELTGRSIPEIQNTWTDLLHPAEKDRYLKNFAESQQKRQPLAMEMRILDKDGNYRWLLGKRLPNYRSDGSFAGFISSGIDITARKQAEGERQMLNAVVEASGEFIGLAGTDTVLKYLNPASLEKLGWQSITGHKIMDCVYPPDREQAQLLLTAFFEYGSSQREIRFYNERSGEPFWVQWNLFAIKDNVTGEITDIASVSPDITERKRHQRELQLVNEEMATANEELASTIEELGNTQRYLEEIVEELSASESRFRFLVQGAPVAIAVLNDRELIIEAANDLVLKIWGKTDEILNMPLALALPELQGQPYLQLLDDVYTSGKAYYGYEEKAYLQHGGELTEFYFDFIYQPIKQGSSGTYSIMVVAIDVTERVNSQKQLQKTQQMLNFAIEAANIGTYVIDANKRNLIASPRLKELFGFYADEVMPYEAAIGQIREDMRESVVAIIDEAFKTGEDFYTEYPIIGFHDQKLRWVRAVGKIDENIDEDNRLFSGALIDITEQKADDQRKNDFIGMVSHELKTPLTSLTALIQVLNVKFKKSGDTFVSGALEKANTQAKKMANMINSFLNVSRLESGKILVIKQHFSLDDLIRETVAETELSASGYQIIFDPYMPLMVYADRDKIGSVVSNLLSNAVKYSVKDTVIEVRYQVLENMVQVSVTDQGIGIKPEDIEKLFDRYFRIESGATKHISGFGIGLYLSAEIINRHGGKIWAESELGKGSTFYFSLPI